MVVRSHAALIPESLVGTLQGFCTAIVMSVICHCGQEWTPLCWGVQSVLYTVLDPSIQFRNCEISTGTSFCLLFCLTGKKCRALKGCILQDS